MGIKTPMRVIIMPGGTTAKLQDAHYWIYPGIMSLDDAIQVADALNNRERYRHSLEMIRDMARLLKGHDDVFKIADTTLNGKDWAVRAAESESK